MRPVELGPGECPLEEWDKRVAEESALLASVCVEHEAEAEAALARADAHLATESESRRLSAKKLDDSPEAHALARKRWGKAKFGVMGLRAFEAAGSERRAREKATRDALEKAAEASRAAIREELAAAARESAADEAKKVEAARAMRAREEERERRAAERLHGLDPTVFAEGRAASERLRRRIAGHRDEACHSENEAPPAAPADTRGFGDGEIDVEWPAMRPSRLSRLYEEARRTYASFEPFELSAADAAEDAVDFRLPDGSFDFEKSAADSRARGDAVLRGPLRRRAVTSRAVELALAFSPREDRNAARRANRCWAAAAEMADFTDARRAKRSAADATAAAARAAEFAETYLREAAATRARAPGDAPYLPPTTDPFSGEALPPEAALAAYEARLRAAARHWGDRRVRAESRALAIREGTLDAALARLRAAAVDRSLTTAVDRAERANARRAGLGERVAAKRREERLAAVAGEAAAAAADAEVARLERALEAAKATGAGHERDARALEDATVAAAAKYAEAGEARAAALDELAAAGTAEFPDDEEGELGQTKEEWLAGLPSSQPVDVDSREREAAAAAALDDASKSLQSIYRSHIERLRVNADEHAAHAAEERHRAEEAVREMGRHLDDDDSDDGGGDGGGDGGDAPVDPVRRARAKAERWRKSTRSARAKAAVKAARAADDEGNAGDLSQLKRETVEALDDFYASTVKAVENRYVFGDDDRGDVAIRDLRASNDRLEKRLEEQIATRKKLDGEFDQYRAAVLAAANASLSKRLETHQALCTDVWSDFRGTSAKLAFAKTASPQKKKAADGAPKRSVFRRATVGPTS